MLTETSASRARALMDVQRDRWLGTRKRPTALGNNLRSIELLRFPKVSEMDERIRVVVPKPRRIGCASFPHAVIASSRYLQPRIFGCDCVFTLTDPSGLLYPDVH